MIIYNRTRGPVRLLGKDLSRCCTMEVDEKLLSLMQTNELQALELYGSIHCTPSVLKVPDPVSVPANKPATEAQVVSLLPRQNGKKARGSR